MVTYNPYAYETHEDPYPLYEALREEAPAYWNEEIGFWALSRHADVTAAFADHKRYSNACGVALDSVNLKDPSTVFSFLAMDPPLHDQMRALVSRGFTPRRIAELEPRIREVAREHIEKFLDVGECDFIDDFAGKLPMDIVSEMLGVPVADRDTLRRWSDTVVHREEGVNDIPPAALEASAELLGYYTEMVADRRKKLGEDLVSALLQAEIDGKRLSDADVIAFLFLMVIAGNETTTKLLGNAVYWIMQNPESRNRIEADPSLIPLWVEETLRYDNSTQALARTMTCDVEMHGRTLREGDRVFLLIGAANRDPRVFSNPEVFDLERDTSEMLSFGRGVHFCLGASLARLEGRVGLEEVVAAMPKFEIDMESLVRVHSINVRGFASMPMRF